MDRKEMDALLRLMRRHGVEKFTFNPQDGALSVEFHTGGVKAAALPAVAAPAPAASAPQSAAPKAAEGKTIRSPIVGTFYQSPAPDAPAYIKVGDHVRKGQVVCIVEAMKLMNQIESDLDGVITEILVENGKPVQFGQELFRLSAG
jgi:acetyl-CoA carboxylase biotin carboxyl carrier protein